MTGAIIAELLIVLMRYGLDLVQIQQELAAGQISETEARSRLKATQEKYGNTRELWDEAGQQPTEPT